MHETRKKRDSALTCTANCTSVMESVVAAVMAPLQHKVWPDSSITFRWQTTALQMFSSLPAQAPLLMPFRYSTKWSLQVRTAAYPCCNSAVLFYTSSQMCCTTNVWSCSMSVHSSTSREQLLMPFIRDSAKLKRMVGCDQMKRAYTAVID